MRSPPPPALVTPDHGALTGADPELCALLDALARGASPPLAELTEALRPLLSLPSSPPQRPSPPRAPQGAVAGSLGAPDPLSALYEELARPSAPRGGRDRLCLALAAALHGVGEALAAGDERGGRARRDARAPEERARDHLAPRLSALPLSPREQERVWGLVGRLHHPRELLRRGAPRGAWWRLARAVDLGDLLLLRRALLRARPSADLPHLLKEQERAERAAAEHLAAGGPLHPEWAPLLGEGLAGLPDLTRRLLVAAAREEAEEGRLCDPREALAFALERARALGERPPPLLHITCAPSGLGKSTWVARAHTGAAVVCMDQARLELTGSAEDQSRNREVFELSLERLRGHLARGAEVAWDATSLLRAHRAPLLELGRRAGALTRIEALLAPPARALAGNSSRERRVPEEVIHGQFARWELPTLDEAHEVVYLTPDEGRPGGWAP